MIDDAARALCAELERAGAPVSAEDLHAACPELGREALYDALWGNPMMFLKLHDGRWTLAEGRDRPVGRHAKPRACVASCDPPLPRFELDGLVLEVAVTQLDAVAPFVVTCAGRNVRLTLNSEHALFRSRSLPFRGDPSTAALEVLLIAWAFEEASTPEGNMKRALSDMRYLVGKRSQRVVRAF